MSHLIGVHDSNCLGKEGGKKVDAIVTEVSKLQFLINLVDSFVPFKVLWSKWYNAYSSGTNLKMTHKVKKEKRH